MSNMQTAFASFDAPLKDSTLKIDTSKLQGSKRTPFEHSPVVVAMLQSRYHSNMRDCQSVREIYSECLATGSDDAICKTAASYFAICMKNDPMDSKNTYSGNES